MANKKIQERKRSKGKISKPYAALVLGLGIAILVTAFILIFYVHEIDVSGNKYTSDEEVIRQIEEDPLSVNSAYLFVKYRFLHPDIPDNMKSIKVSLKSPWKVKVNVQEKEIVGCFLTEGKYYFFDKKGIIIGKSKEKMDGIPIIEGAVVKELELYQKIKMKDKKLLEAILDVAQELKNYNLAPDKIECADDGINLYFGEIQVKLGSEITASKMAQIAPIIARLGKKSGVLHLERYVNDNTTITFTDSSIEVKKKSSKKGSEEDADGEAEENLTDEDSGEDFLDEDGGEAVSDEEDYEESSDTYDEDYVSE